MTEPANTQAAPAASPPVSDTERFASLLASGERVLVVRQRHWFTFIQAARWFVLVLLGGVVVGILGQQVDATGSPASSTRS